MSDIEIEKNIFRIIFSLIVTKKDIKIEIEDIKIEMEDKIDLIYIFSIKK